LLIGGPSAAMDGPRLEVDTEASRVYAKVTSSTRLGHDHGVVGRLSSGSLTLGGPCDLVFDMRTFVSDRPEARDYVGLTKAIPASDADKVTATMLGKDVLDVAQFPTARYACRSMSMLDDQAAGAPGRYRLEGEFTLHGMVRTMPLTATLEKTDKPGVLRMRCTFPVLQSAHGIKPYKAVGGLVGVNDTLEIWGDLVLRAATAKGTR
jgi:hypothetical protein